ncbi:hypothetical protein AB205_0114680 [Aquarana catesbeiana]|uniref:Uncharacterized protein n=1 Tax=Aquarana catesbeiana TaxID=8400 RepID=A0A2G9S617_AQUCT|nr:hypothetical protein AB205_0114680 [Aquarana catesbeiana]
MYCSQDLDFIKQKTHEIEVKLKNMIDVLGRINTQKMTPFFFVFNMFLCILKGKFYRCTQCVNMCYLPSGDINVRVLWLQPLPRNSSN